MSKKVLINLLSGQWLSNYIVIKQFSPDIVVNLATERYKGDHSKLKNIFVNIEFVSKEFSQNYCLRS